MKSVKPLVFVLAAILITIALFSFKNETTEKENATLKYTTNSIPMHIDLYLENEVKSFDRGKGQEPESAIVGVLNALSKEGWEIVENGSPYTTSGVQFIRLQRIKR